MMGVAGHCYIVIPVEAQAGSEALRGVALALVAECLGALAEVSVENALQTHLPLA